MFIYNLKINGTRFFKLFFFSTFLILFILIGLVFFKVFNGASDSSKFSCLPQNNINKISPNNYSNVLKAVHENIDEYIGMKINFTGYIYRVLDLKENQFVIARDMIISSDFQSVIIGFLCEYEDAKDFEDNTWVELTGEITKGNYHGDMPIIKVTTITRTNKPNVEYVYPPDDNYIPTTGIL